MIETLTRLRLGDSSRRLARQLTKLQEIASGSDAELLANRRIVDQIGLEMAPFQADSDARQLRERQEAEAAQRRIADAARVIRTRYNDYRLQMATAVARFPDIAPLRRDFEILLLSSSAYSDADLPDFDTTQVQPAWLDFTAQRAANQLELDHQHGRRIFIHNTELADIRGRTATIEQRMINFQGGRPSPRNPLLLHERLAEVRVYNENIIYTWQGNDLYLHGIVTWHLDEDMSGSQRDTSRTIEDRGATPANFTEVRYRGGAYVVI